MRSTRLAMWEQPSLGWHVISGEMFLEALRRVESGENSDLVYAEMWANADHEHVEGDEDE